MKLTPEEQEQIAEALTMGESRRSSGCASVNGYASRPVTLKDRVRWRLYPANHCDLPEAPPKWKDVLVCRTVVNLSMLDRLRILVSGRLMVETRTVTENEIGAHVTGSVAYPLPPKALDREA